jgi:hypothetical protein
MWLGDVRRVVEGRQAGSSFLLVQLQFRTACDGFLLVMGDQYLVSTSLLRASVFLLDRTQPHVDGCLAAATAVASAVSRTMVFTREKDGAWLSALGDALPPLLRPTDRPRRDGETSALLTCNKTSSS